MKKPDSKAPTGAARSGVKRRDFLRRATASTGVGAAAAAAGLARPALSKGLKKWRMQTTWPRDFPGLGTGANVLAAAIGKLSAGRLSVEVFGGDEIVPAFETMDAVSSGTIEMGHSAPYYWKGKVPATQYLAVLPFGLNIREQSAWLQAGGGQALGDRIYRELGCKFFPSGNTGEQMGGWFNIEITSLDDMRGLKMRIPGLGGEVMKAAAIDVINLPGNEIAPSLKSGAIDATEWVGPYNDLALGLHEGAKFYYYPGWQEPATILDNFINLKAWEALDDELKGVIELANAYTNQYVINELMANNAAALDTLVNEHGVVLKKFPDSVLNELGRLSGEVIGDLAAEDPMSRDVMDAVLAFRKQAIAFAKVSDQAFYNARTLPFRYVEL